MKEYHKIQTVFKRDPDNNYKTLLLGEFAAPELGYLSPNEWVFTEKVDGTNIRVMFGGHEVTFGGKTDRAQIPAKLVNKLRERFPFDKMLSMFEAPVCLYGEGFGAGIQKGGGNYSPDQDFVLFDVKIDEWWLERENIEGIARNLDIPIVPIIRRGSLHDMIEMAREGFRSEWGDFLAEGIVARPAIELKARNGSRIITKIKHKDFAE
jgi:hypothetical protein